MDLTLTPLYAVPLAALYVALSIHVIRFRRANRIALGDAGEADLARRIRAHANFAEYAPFGLLLMLIAELAGAGAGVLHLTGGLLLVGRVVHAYHLCLRPTLYNLRVVAMTCTFTALGLGAGAGLVAAI